MKTLLIPLLLILSSCSSLTTKNVPEKKIPQVEKTVSLKYAAIWDLLSEQKIILHLNNVDKASPLKITLLHGIERKEVPVGHWELVGFEFKGKKYFSSGTSKRYVLNMKPKTDIYAGSLVVDCPKVSAKDFHLLKKMKFFNRYTFSRNGDNCEIVVGNDFDRVRSALINSSKSKKLNLKLGL